LKYNKGVKKCHEKDVVVRDVARLRPVQLHALPVVRQTVRSKEDIDSPAGGR